MILVNIWLPEGQNVGHASMLVQSTYVSWWPDTRVGKKNAASALSPIRNKSYASDVADEGKTPTNTVTLNGLDEAKILGWWASFGLVQNGQELSGPLPPYVLLTQNCSTVVARGLMIGGGDTYASWWVSRSVVWRPQTALDYARSIETGLAEKAKK